MSERDLRALLALVEAHLGKSWLEISEWLRDQNSVDAIEARLLAYDFQGVVKEVEAAALRFASETHSQFILAGQRGAKWLDSKLPDKLIRFDVDNHRAVQAAQQNKLELVQGLTLETRETVHAIIVEGQRAGTNPRAWARDIRDSIGLTPNQDAAVRSYRQALRDSDWSNALGRELSSGHSDRTLRRLQRDGGQLTEEQIDQMVSRYRENQRAWRAENIARTEASANVHAGLDEAFEQAISRGDISRSDLRGEWIPGPATLHSREQHRSSYLTDQRPMQGEDFVMGDGTRMRHPGDRRGGPKHTAHCRCTKATTLVAA